MQLYGVQGTVTLSMEGGWQTTRQLPTFYLSADVQGITSADHAERIARRMLSETNPAATINLHVEAMH